MRTTTTACVMAAMLSLASCTPPAEGTLVGQVKMYGGPASTSTGRQGLDGEPGPGIQVTVSVGSQVIATTTSDASGRFTFHLAPGTYTLCSNSQPVTVAADVQSTADCIAAVP